MIDILLLALLITTVAAAAIDHRKYRQALSRAELLIAEAEARAAAANESVNREINSLSQTFEAQLPDQLREAMQPLYGIVVDLQKTVQSQKNEPRLFGFSFPIIGEDKPHE